MPVIVNGDAYDLWLDPEMKNVAQVSELLKPFDARQMRCYPVSNRVNHVANDGTMLSAYRTERRTGVACSRTRRPAMRYFPNRPFP